MSRILVIFNLMVFSLLGAAISQDESFKGAVKEAPEKLVLMIYTADDCPECAYMKKKVFHDPQVEGYMNANFTLLEKNVHRDRLPDGFDYFGIPTMFFIDRDGVKRETLIGSRRAPEFARELHRIREMK